MPIFRLEHEEPEMEDDPNATPLPTPKMSLSAGMCFLIPTILELILI